ncbi:MAG: hypothetical protein AAF149_07300 [Bacteroidota bacterium]
MTTKTHFLVTLLTVLSLAVHATDKKDNEKETTFEVVRQGNVFKLFYLNKDIVKVNVKIVDESGNIVFTERIKNEEGFMRPYNFKDLEYGDYKIIISEKDQHLTTTVHHGSDLIIKEEALKPLRLIKMDQMNDVDRIFKLTIVNQGDAQASISVKNEDKEVIFSITESFTGNYGKLFNLAGVNGETSFEVTLDGKTTVFAL